MNKPTIKNQTNRIYIYISIYLSTCISTYTYHFVYIYIYIPYVIYIYVYIYIHIRVCVSVYIYIYIQYTHISIIDNIFPSVPQNTDQPTLRILLPDTSARRRCSCSTEASEEPSTATGRFAKGGGSTTGYTWPQGKPREKHGTSASNSGCDVETIEVGIFEFWFTHTHCLQYVLIIPGWQTKHVCMCISSVSHAHGPGSCKYLHVGAYYLYDCIFVLHSLRCKQHQTTTNSPCTYPLLISLHQTSWLNLFNPWPLTQWCPIVR